MTQAEARAQFGKTRSILRHILVDTTMSDKQAFARELGLFKRLRNSAPDLAFWESVRPAIKLDTLLYFYGPYAAAQLKQDYGLYEFGKAEQARAEAAQLENDIRRLENDIRRLENELDKLNKTDRIEENRPKRQSTAQWVDAR